MPGQRLPTVGAGSAAPPGRPEQPQIKGVGSTGVALGVAVSERRTEPLGLLFFNGAFVVASRRCTGRQSGASRTGVCGTGRGLSPGIATTG